MAISNWLLSYFSLARNGYTSGNSMKPSCSMTVYNNNAFYNITTAKIKDSGFLIDNLSSSTIGYIGL